MSNCEANNCEENREQSECQMKLKPQEILYAILFTCMKCSFFSDKLTCIMDHIHGPCKFAGKVDIAFQKQSIENSLNSKRSSKQNKKKKCSSCCELSYELSKERVRCEVYKKLIDLYCKVDISKLYFESEFEIRLIDPCGEKKIFKFPTVETVINGNLTYPSLPPTKQYSEICTQTTPKKLVTTSTTTTTTTDTETEIKDIMPKKAVTEIETQTTPLKRVTKKRFSRGCQVNLVQTQLTNIVVTPIKNSKDVNITAKNENNENKTYDCTKLVFIDDENQTNGPVQSENETKNVLAIESIQPVDSIDPQTPDKQLSEPISVTPKFKTPKFKTPVVRKMLTFEKSDIKIEYPKDVDDLDNKTDDNGRKYSKYKSFKTITTVRAEEDLTDPEKLKEVAEKFDVILKDYVPFDNDMIKKIDKECTDIIRSISNDKKYTKHLELLKAKRYQMFGNIDFIQYLEILDRHLELLNRIFRTFKEFKDRKADDVICKSLMPIEQKIKKIGYWLDIRIDPTVAACLRRAATFSNVHTLKFEPLDLNNEYSNLISKMNTPALMYLGIGDLLKRLMFNKYGFNNIVYIPLKNSDSDDTKTEDLYTFYYLHKTSNGKRYWNMDYKLLKFASELRLHMIRECTNRFRQIYYETYGTNSYINLNGKYENPTMMCEGKQLTDNLSIVSNTLQFSIYLRELVREFATYIPTENDRFNLYGEDLETKRLIDSEGRKFDNCDSVLTFRSLFIDASVEEAADFMFQNGYFD